MMAPGCHGLVQESFFPMNAPFKRAGLGLVCASALLLAACGSSSSSTSTSGPSLDTGLSQAGLEASLEVGQSANYYAYFSGATSEGLDTDGNPDNLPLTLDSTGTSGKLTLSPTSTTMPGIYSLLIFGADSGGTSQVTFDATVYPAGNLSGHPTILTFVPDASQPTAGVVGGTVTLPARTGLALVASSATFSIPSGTGGITVDSTTVTPVSPALTNTPDAVIVSAHLTVTRNSVTPGAVKPGTVTDNAGNSYSTGLELVLLATPPSNGLTLLPYAESVYINNLSTL